MIPLPVARFLPVQPTVELVFGLARPDRSGATVQLAAARSGDGTTALARDMALVAAGPAGLRVLLVCVEPINNWPGGLMNPARLMDVDAAGLRQVAGCTLRIAALMLGEAPLTWLGRLRDWRPSFDLIVIDSPAIDRSAACVLLAPHVDATLLVVGAETTPMEAVIALRNRLWHVGGTVKGTLFNKQRRHLPRVLDAML